MYIATLVRNLQDLDKLEKVLSHWHLLARLWDRGERLANRRQKEHSVRVSHAR